MHDQNISLASVWTKSVMLWSPRDILRPLRNESFNCLKARIQLSSQPILASLIFFTDLFFRLPAVLYAFSSKALEGSSCLCSIGNAVEIQVAECINWHNLAAGVGETVFFNVSQFFGSKWYPISSMIRPQHLIDFKKKLDLGNDMVKFFSLHVFKERHNFDNNSA